MRERGIIKTYLTKKGFGFITREGYADIFFHVSELDPADVESIQNGAAVEFTVTSDRCGRPQAASVALLSEVRGKEIL